MVGEITQFHDSNNNNNRRFKQQGKEGGIHGGERHAKLGGCRT